MQYAGQELTPSSDQSIDRLVHGRTRFLLLELDRNLVKRNEECRENVKCLGGGVNRNWRSFSSKARRPIYDLKADDTKRWGSFGSLWSVTPRKTFIMSQVTTPLFTADWQRLEPFVNALGGKGYWSISLLGNHIADQWWGWGKETVMTQKGLALQRRPRTLAFRK